jgi:hypothetical protein
MNAPILQPVVALICWSLLVWLWLYATRLPAIAKAKPDFSIIKNGRSLQGVLPQRVNNVADNYNHLMEQPTIFYAACFALALLGSGDGMNLLLAWVYVGFRVAHSLWQSLINHVPTRFALHVLGTIPLIMLAAHAAMAAF